ncbi:MAG TPA: histidine kinase dimerization/phosphoacceptor domain -containing protein [Rhizobiaceae bacterium]
MRPVRRLVLIGQDVDTGGCEREPIRIPGSIQPHGILLVVDRGTGRVTHAAGDVAGKLGAADWLHARVHDLLGAEVAEAILSADATLPRQVTPPLTDNTFDLSVARGDRLIVELEDAAPTHILATLLPKLEAAGSAFEKAVDMAGLLAGAARSFRALTGYDRVMIYRFLDDAAGKVVAEDASPDHHSFLHHHFPASDIPAQARALYVRNLVRVIPDVHYRPAPLQPELPADDPLDMSDCSLRSVSPIHIQYLKNMGVAASASFSIVKEGELWGLVACHNLTPRMLPLDVRGACRALAAGLARQIKSREETDAYRERVRLRTFEDRIVELLLRNGSLDDALSKHLKEIQEMLDADGVAVLRGNEAVIAGKCPSQAEIKSLAGWIAGGARQPVFSTNELAADAALSEATQPLAAGLLAMTLSAAEPWMVLWFRAEAVEIVNWAGNPHKAVTAGPDGALTPRASFDAWSETVRGRARRWSVPEVEAVERLAVAIQNVWQTRRIRDLNKELMHLVEEKEVLLKQKEFLLGEVNHRVQNSLTLVSSFLSLQARESSDQATRDAIEEARRRISAVSLVHRRLYGSEQIRTVDAARYVEDLLHDLLTSFGDEWRGMLTLDLEPVLLPNDRAISAGLVLTELVINANKYAYAGAPGALKVALSESGSTFRLIVSDMGGGRVSTRPGFGSRMLDALVQQLGGTLEFSDNQPGTRAVLAAPIGSSLKG